jgi:hypothetical protein
MKSEPIEGLVQVIERAIRARGEGYKPCCRRVIAINAKRTSSGESKGA